VNSTRNGADDVAAQASGGHARLLGKILKTDLLILDDFGLYPLTPQGAQDMYEIISERYERASIILTSNRALEEWPAVFDNDLLASAALDRLTHHTHTLVIRGSSYPPATAQKGGPRHSLSLARWRRVVTTTPHSLSDQHSANTFGVVSTTRLSRLLQHDLRVTQNTIGSTAMAHMTRP
jgi:hypothetical protein